MNNLKLNDSNPIHLLIFPFPSSGHVIPLLDLTRHLLTLHPHHFIITFLITPPSLSLLQPLLNTFSSSHLQPLLLSPPISLPSTSIVSEMRALHALSHPIISWFRSHPNPPRVLLCDFFLGWTHSLSSTLHLPRVVFYPSGSFASSVMYSMWSTLPDNPDNDPDFEIRFDDIPSSPRFKWAELSQLFRVGKNDPEWDLLRTELLSNLTSWGAVFNSFSELESVWFDHFRKEMGHDRVWAVGPLLPDEEDSAQVHRGGPSSEQVLTWLDEKPEGSVVYVCFGSRTSLTVDELEVLGAALECSGVHFIWCIRGGETITPDSDYEDRVGGRGYIVRGWAPQVAILRHRGVGAFLTHCGWNSVLESISAGVMTLAWPMGADQYSNAQLIAGQLGLGLRVLCHGPNDIPDGDQLARLLVDSVDPTRPEKGRVMRLKEAAATAIKYGSSVADLEMMVKCFKELNK